MLITKNPLMKRLEKIWESADRDRELIGDRSKCQAGKEGENADDEDDCDEHRSRRIALR